MKIVPIIWFILLFHTTIAYSSCNNFFTLVTEGSDVNIFEDWDYAGSSGTAHLLLSDDNVLDEPVIVVEGIDFFNGVDSNFIVSTISAQQPIIR